MAADTLWKQRIRDGSTIQETNPERRDCCGAGAIVGEEWEVVKPTGSGKVDRRHHLVWRSGVPRGATKRSLRGRQGDSMSFRWVSLRSSHPTNASGCA
ncbi:hypothetical protein VK98_14155 [Chromobacterium sp. LK11]|nr:hypothetical protein VK98_14155 [Chromobacterium sp. LK11]